MTRSISSPLDKRLLDVIVVLEGLALGMGTPMLVEFGVAALIPLAFAVVWSAVGLEHGSFTSLATLKRLGSYLIAFMIGLAVIIVGG